MITSAEKVGNFGEKGSYFYMSRVLFVSLFAFLFGSASPVFSAESQPNVLIVLVDDQGYYDLGCYGATEVKTPRIDALAKAGIRFTDYYAAAPICTPSRAGLLTGCYPRRIGLETWVQRADSKIGIHPDERTLGELFGEAGYTTTCIGKWHLGFADSFLPLSQGFDHYYGLHHNLDPVEIVYFENGDVPIYRNEEVVDPAANPDTLTKLYTDEAIAQIDAAGDEPFFIYLAHTMLHVPLGSTEDFRGSSEWGEYGDAIQEMDHNVGRIMDHLKEIGELDNTYVVYLSDNGRGPGRNETQPLKGRKLTTWEAGIRVPAILSGPEVPGAKVNSKIVTAMDWFPTLASFAGIEVTLDRALDGRDLSGRLTGGRVEAINAKVENSREINIPKEWSELFTERDYRDAFFYHGAEGALSAVRSGDLKLMLSPSLALYDLSKDPSENKPMRSKESRRLRGMAILFQEEMRQDGRPVGHVDRLGE
ncbi:MAG: sulfatase-like hydrolase/transferase [Verrucomicrobiales bacterium]|nr:sulfatase-like hydrolase/transferase [Verrucomicrobiales bacterium]